MKVALGLLFDLVALAGVGLVVFGVAQLSEPAAFIVGGAMVFLAAAAAARRVAKL